MTLTAFTRLSLHLSNSDAVCNAEAWEQTLELSVYRVNDVREKQIFTLLQHAYPRVVYLMEAWRVRRLCLRESLFFAAVACYRSCAAAVPRPAWWALVKLYFTGVLHFTYNHRVFHCEGTHSEGPLVICRTQTGCFIFTTRTMCPVLACMAVPIAMTSLAGMLEQAGTSCPYCVCIVT